MTVLRNLETFVTTRSSLRASPLLSLKKVSLCRDTCCVKIRDESADFLDVSDLLHLFFGPTSCVIN